MTPPGFADDFDAAGLDTGVWVPHYLPMWSSRAQTAATYDVGGSELRLTIPPAPRRLMVACAPEAEFDFPDRAAAGNGADHVPELVVDRVAGPRGS